MRLEDYINTGKVLNSNDVKSVKSDEEFLPDEITPDSLCMVHSTAFFPRDNIILSSSDGGKLTPDKKAYIARPTVHFALNGVVSDHYAGSWEDNAYTIIEPLSEHMSEIECIHSVDTWTANSVKLSNKAIILVDERTKDNLKDMDLSKYNIIYYSGSRDKIVNFVLTKLGYKVQYIGDKSWQQNGHGSTNFEPFETYFKEKYPNLKRGLHDGTSYRKCEIKIIYRNRFLYNINILLENEKEDNSLIKSTNGTVLSNTKALAFIRCQMALSLPSKQKEKYKIDFSELKLGDITEKEIEELQSIDFLKITNDKDSDFENKFINNLIDIGIIYDENEKAFKLIPDNILFEYYDNRYMIKQLEGEINDFEKTIESLEFYKNHPDEARNNYGFKKSTEEIDNEINHLKKLINDRKIIIEHKKKAYDGMHEELYKLASKAYNEFNKMLIAEKEEQLRKAKIKEEEERLQTEIKQIKELLSRYETNYSYYLYKKIINLINKISEEKFKQELINKTEEIKNNLVDFLYKKLENITIKDILSNKELFHYIKSLVPYYTKGEPLDESEVYLPIGDSNIDVNDIDFDVEYDCIFIDLNNYMNITGRDFFKKLQEIVNYIETNKNKKSTSIKK